MLEKIMFVLSTRAKRMCAAKPHNIKAPTVVGPSIVKTFAFLFFFGLAAIDPAIAGGFDKVDENATNFQDMLKALAVIIVTCAIMFAGFKIIFQGARFGDVAGILIGGTLIGGASGLAGWIATPD